MTQPHRRSCGGAFRFVLSFVFSHWWRQPCLFVAIVSATLGATVADILLPLYAGRLVDAVTRVGDSAAATQQAMIAFAMLIGLGLLAAILRYLMSLGIVRFTLKTMSEIVQDSFLKVQRFSTEWHANSFAGATVRKVMRGVSALDLLNDTILIALLPTAAMLFGMAISLAFHWLLMGLVVALSALVFIALTAILSLAYVAPAATLSNQWDTTLGGMLADAISCNAVIKSFGAEVREDNRLARVVAKWHKRTMRTWIRGANTFIAQLLMLTLLRVLVIGGGLWLWLRGEAGAGEITYVLTAYFLLHGYLVDMGENLRNLQRSINDMEELVELGATPLGIADRQDAVPIRITGGQIRFDAVTFYYSGHKTPLYQDLSILIKPGERVGLVGHSGSGKTSFVKLVQRLYDVSSGRIMIDGQDIREVTQASLRAATAIVQQEPLLFHRSLAENIAYGRPWATQAEIERAARLANADGFISHLPKGYGTLVGERGMKLSGGERQRVVIARAFLADAPILILDEATSSLDSESEVLVQEAMERLMVGRTTIIIAHRLSTVRALDRLLVFDRGQVVEEGDHKSLVAHEGGIYRRLFETQVLELSKGLAAE